MPQSLTDMINLGASVITILGGSGATLGAFTRWRARQKPPAPQPQPSHGQGTWPPATAQAPVVRRTAPPSQRGVSHPAILGFALAGLIAIFLYSVESLINAVLSGGATAAVASGSPLSYLNATLIALNLVCTIAVCASMMVTAYRVERPAWVAIAALTLLISLLTLGVFSVVALAPALYFGLSGPRAGR